MWLEINKFLLINLKKYLELKFEEFVRGRVYKGGGGGQKNEKAKSFRNFSTILSNSAQIYFEKISCK